MSKRSYIVALAAVFALAGGSAIVAAQQQPNRAGDRQADLFRRLDEGIVTFRASFDRAMNRSRMNGSRSETDINKAVNDFKLATDRLGDRAQQRRVVAADAEDVLRRATAINDFMATNALDTTVERDWRNLRGDLDELAREYDVAWNWNSPRNDGDWRGAALNQRLTGTYQLENSQGDDAERAVQQAVRTLPANQRQAASKRLMNRLNAPETIAIDRRGNNITMASSRGRQVTLRRRRSGAHRAGRRRQDHDHSRHAHW